jgi:hypothetical protein
MVNIYKRLNDRMIKAVKRIVLEDPDVVFCGSLGLYLNDLLDRPIHDIDILTPTNYYNRGGFFEDERIAGNSDSHKFMVGIDRVMSFKLNIYDVNIDVLYNKNTPPEWEEMKFDGIKIRVEKPMSAIKVKQLYLQNDKSQYSVVKHLKDLILMDVLDKEKIIELIDNSVLVEDPKGVKQQPCGELDLPF